MSLKLGEKQKSLFKLAVWTCLLVWMVFFLAFSITIAQRAAILGPTIFSFWANVLSFVLPVWIIFTACLIIIYMARWAKKKMDN